MSRFSEGVRFRLVAESDAVISDIILFRQLQGERVRVRAYPEFTPGRRVEVLYNWELEPGDLPPGAMLSYSWELRDQAGNTLRTEPVAFTYEDDRFSWQQLEQGALTVRYYGSRAQLAQEVLESAWDAAERLQRDVEIEITEPIRIYLYNSRTDMRAALSPRSAIYDARTVTLGVAMGGNTLLLLASDSAVRDTVAHEMSHLIVGLATENPYTDLPRWLDEGLAMYAEGELPSDNRQALQKAIRENELISVRSLSSYVGDPSQVDLFYGESYSVVDFMLKRYGRESMNRLLDTISRGVLAEEALQQVYGLSIEGLDDAWRASLGLEPRAAGAGTPVATPLQRSPSICGGPAVAFAFLGLLLLFVTRGR